MILAFGVPDGIGFVKEKIAFVDADLAFGDTFNEIVVDVGADPLGDRVLVGEVILSEKFFEEILVLISNGAEGLKMVAGIQGREKRMKAVRDGPF